MNSWVVCSHQNQIVDSWVWTLIKYLNLFESNFKGCKYSHLALKPLQYYELLLYPMNLVYTLYMLEISAVNTSELIDNCNELQCLNINVPWSLHHCHYNGWPLKKYEITNKHNGMKSIIMPDVFVCTKKSHRFASRIVGITSACTTCWFGVTSSKLLPASAVGFGVVEHSFSNTRVQLPPTDCGRSGDRILLMSDDLMDALWTFCEEAICTSWREAPRWRLVDRGDKASPSSSLSSFGCRLIGRNDMSLTALNSPTLFKCSASRRKKFQMKRLKQDNEI